MSHPPLASSAWAWFLDVDGTLLDLAETPDAVHIDRRLPSLLRTLHESSSGALALISGRSLVDLDHRLGLPWLPIAGQHGMERRNANGDIHRHQSSPFSSEIFTTWLAPLLARHPGLLIEDKGSTLAIHYRLAPQLGGYLHRCLHTLVAQSEGFHLQRGKRVLEIKPAGYDKGSAIAEYLTEPPFSGRTPVFIGDDLTDEHGFAIVNRLGGISVKVGAGRTTAHYRLPGVEAVHAWLAEIPINDLQRA